jgi:hypothetical protein
MVYIRAMLVMVYIRAVLILHTHVLLKIVWII